MPIQIAAPLPSAAPVVGAPTLAIVAKLLLVVLVAAPLVWLHATLPAGEPEDAMQTIAGP